jgi:phage tail P2-like protein
MSDLPVVTLLSPNASPLLRAIERVLARRLERLTTAVDAVLDPYACPIAFLPFLAWAVSVDVWRSDWPEAQKRAAVAASLAVHRRKGTVAGVKAALNALNARVDLREWFNTGGAPFTGTARIYAASAAGAPQLSPELLADLQAALVASGRATGHLVFQFGVSFTPALTPTASTAGSVVQARPPMRLARQALPAAPLRPVAGWTRPVVLARVGGGQSALLRAA